VNATLHLQGLEPAPAQVLGNVRLVPLLRRDVRGDLRLARRRYGDDLTMVSVDEGAYFSFIPHGLVVSWTADGSPVAACGASLAAPGKAEDLRRLGGGLSVLHRMAKRGDDRTLRLLPLHLAMEGFLARSFRGPDIAWSEYARKALRDGLDPRVETSWSGRALPGFEDALRVFEIHERQSGVLVFVADALASAFVVPCPDDYRALHRSLIDDFFGELLVRYGYLFPEAPPVAAPIDAAKVASLDDLRAAVEGMRRDHRAFTELLTGEAVGRPIEAELVYALGPFRLDRFLTSLRLHEENHLGERVLRDDGTVEYLKTFRLSDAQARRAWLLQQLAAHDWELSATAAAMGTDQVDLCRRLESAGFGYLLAPAVLAAARRR
jgi:hypothetical protein